MNRLFWFALGSVGTLTAGIIYLATREEKLATVAANDSEGLAGIAGESSSTLRGNSSDFNLCGSNWHGSNSFNPNSLEPTSPNSLRPSYQNPNKDGGNDA